MTKTGRTGVVRVSAVFPLTDKQWLLAHLSSFEWDFSSYGPVYLCLNDKKVLMRYIGFGNHNGIPVVTLVPADENFPTVQDVLRVLGESPHQMYLKRVISEA